MSQPEWKLQTAVGKFIRSAVIVPHYFEAYDRSKNDSAGMRHTWEAARHVKSGTPDTALIVDGRIYRIELKAPGNKPTDRQEERMAEIRHAGGYAGWADTVKGVGVLLQVWGIPLAANWAMQALYHDGMLEAGRAKVPAQKKASRPRKERASTSKTGRWAAMQMKVLP